MGTARWILVAGLIAGVSSACSTETNLTVTARGESAEGETVPLSNVVLDVLPYDIDELYGELEAETQPGAEPSADSIRQLSQRYQDACAAYRSTGDSIEIVQQRATAITDRTSPEYNAVFAEYQALVAREQQRFDDCQAITDRYTDVRNQYREERQAWEERAWPEDRFTAAEAERIGEQPVQSVETGPEGSATLTVPNGRWWILGTAPVPGSISQQYRWNLAIEAQGGEQTVELTSENAELEPVF
ncbi:MAG TPA: hypothetical protein VFQ21_11855 [Gemmatimonadota bacterium]|nr:hypothetical protein [Gemmatimonadota bacterium]